MIPLGLLGPLSGWELLVILLIVVLLFGSRRIPELARGLGEGIRNFRSSVKEPDSGGHKDEVRENSSESEK